MKSRKYSHPRVRRKARKEEKEAKRVTNLRTLAELRRRFKNGSQSGLTMKQELPSLVVLVHQPMEVELILRSSLTVAFTSHSLTTQQQG